MNENNIKVSEKVETEIIRIKAQASLVPSVRLQTDNSPQSKTILFQNVRSLHLLHIDDVRSDYNIQKDIDNISFVNSQLKEMTLELVMKVLCTLRWLKAVSST